jgi:hypothetical protein
MLKAALAGMAQQLLGAPLQPGAQSAAQAGLATLPQRRPSARR